MKTIYQLLQSISTHEDHFSIITEHFYAGILLNNRYRAFLHRKTIYQLLQSIFIHEDQWYLAACGKPSLYMPTTAAPPSPMLCCSPILAPSTCLLLAIPLNCQHSSAHWAKPIVHVDIKIRNEEIMFWRTCKSGKSELFYGK